MANEEAERAERDWRAMVVRRLQEHFDRLEAGDIRMNAIEDKIDHNTDVTERVEKNTKIVVTWVTNITGFKNVVDWVGALFLKLAAFVGACGILYWAVATGQLPKRVEAPIEHPVQMAMAAARRDP